MSRFELNTNPTSRYQSHIMTIKIDGQTMRVDFTLRYLNEAGMWFFSIFDADTGKPYCLYVPVIASYDPSEVNNLLEPFKHKRIGRIFCIPVVSEPSTVDPGLDNLEEFAIIWGDNE